jgi:hypothetical protein
MNSLLRTLPHLSLYDLKNPIVLQKIYLDTTNDYYWSNDFSALFYYTQAQAGFIAVTEHYHDDELLLPELQHRYALLHFKDLHATRHTRKILRRDRPTLRIGSLLRPTAERIRTYHNHAWLTSRYEQVLDAVNQSDLPMHVIAATLYHDHHPIAGEIGYILGRTYTSLSGYSSKERRYRHYGMVQLFLLGQWLEQKGFAFWNLGQPYMPYKFVLGAREYSRGDFLRLWHPAVTEGLDIHSITQP